MNPDQSHGKVGAIARRCFIFILAFGMVFSFITPSMATAMADSVGETIPLSANSGTSADGSLVYASNITVQQRNEAADNFKQAYSSAQAAQGDMSIMATPTMDPAGVPHYFGPYANYAFSPQPKGPVTTITLVSGGSGYFHPVVTITDAYYTGSGATATATFNASTGAITGFTITNGGSGYTAPQVTITDSVNAAATGASATASIGGTLTGGIRKFVDSLPGLNAANANNLGQYIPVAIPDTTTYPGSDYYVIELGQYTEKLHSDLPATTLRGYRQVNTVDPTVSKFSYLGPLIIAKQDRPVRVKFINNLPTGTGGNLFIPVDKTEMGAGMGPLGMDAMPMDYTENRATIHLHGGDTPWISDGTTDQWTTPAGENTPYPQGVSVYNVPDMDGGKEPIGTLTFFYSNQQSARLMFYHDHSLGITRLNVYAGEAGGYLLTDQVEKDMIDGTNVMGINPNSYKVLPDTGIPLIIQDKTFVDASTIAAQDPTWAWGTTPGTPHTGDLWFPHVYMPNQNPYDPTGANAFGRWDYAPWFYPPVTNLQYGPVANPYYDPVNAPWEPPVMPNMPTPSMVMEAFMDTPLVNGAAYPNMTVEPKAYRFRILNAADDRFLNLQMYVADPTVTTADGRTNTEVKMVPAAPTAGYPATWPTDGRVGGVPDPTTAGPSWIQIGTEGGFLPEPVVVPNQPVTWNANMKTFNFGNVKDHSLLLGTAERADVIVDFSQYAGKTIILYNDAPAAFPAYDPRNDYYTGDPDQTGSGGTSTTMAGYGPNTRTIMQIKVAATRSDAQPITAYNLANLQSVFAKAAGKRGVFEVSQPPTIVAQEGYNSAYNGAYPNNAFGNVQDYSLSFNTISGNALTIATENKAIHDEMGAAFDPVYGRLSGFLGLETPNIQPGAANALLFPYHSPPVDILVASATVSEPQAGDGTQIWKISHNGIDTHTIHFHLFNVQVINRVAWDGSILPPDPNELGWKDTVRVNPLETTFLAMRPVVPSNIPFDIPDNIRPIDVTMPLGVPLADGPGGMVDPLGNAVTIPNHLVNYGWEYVYHCHILSHEEMDMMHSVVVAVPPRAPTNLVATPSGANVVLTWTDNSASETGFTVQRAADPNFQSGLATFTTDPNVNTYTDTTANAGQVYYYRVQANNLVGDTQTPNFPTKTANSAFTNVVTYQVAAPAAAFVSDTIPAYMVEGTTYNVSVTYQNSGNTAWTSANGVDLAMWGQLWAYTINNDATLPGALAFTIPAGTVVNPGQSYTWNFQVTPIWSGHWGLGFQPVQTSTNTWMATAESRTQTIYAAAPNAAFVSETIQNANVEGNAKTVSVTFQNTGNSTWTSAKGIELVMWGQLWAYTIGNDATLSGYPAFTVPAGVTVNPGEQYTWTFPLTPQWSGTWGLGYQVVQTSTNTWMGSPGSTYTTVAAQAPSANYVGNTMPATMTVGHTTPVTITFTNNGNSDWTSGKGDVLVMWGDTGSFNLNNMGMVLTYPAFPIPAGTTVQPGQSYTWTVQMTPLYAGTYNFGFQVVQTSTGTWMGNFGGASTVASL